MLNKRIFLPALVVALVGASSAASAQVVQFFFTKTTDSTPITSLTLTKGQASFDLSVWYVVQSGSFPNLAAEAMVGFDTSAGPDIGATPLDHIFQLNGTTATAITNFSSDYAFAQPPGQVQQRATTRMPPTT